MVYNVVQLRLKNLKYSGCRDKTQKDDISDNNLTDYNRNTGVKWNKNIS